MKKILAPALILLRSFSYRPDRPSLPTGRSIGRFRPQGLERRLAGQVLTIPEKTNYTRTASSRRSWNPGRDALEQRQGHRPEYVHHQPAPGRAAVVLSNPRALRRGAAKSGKTVVYFQGNIHPYEPEAKEACNADADILFGRRSGLLDKLIIIMCPTSMSTVRTP